MHAFFLASQYIKYNRIKSALLICGITLTMFVPAAMYILVHYGEAKLLERADSTPIVIGAKGSRVDLTLHALYFRSKAPAPIPMSEAHKVRDSKLADAIPIYGRFTARGYPIIGTSLDYFSFRRLNIAEGRSLTRLGDCVLGARVAEDLGLTAGDHLLSDSENVFDIAGAYPLKMLVRGVLAEARSEDDYAVFVDIKTAWIIAGFGHGHQDVVKANESVILERHDREVIANAALTEYTEITDENLESFHFHGEIDDFPITALIALPKDEKSETLLRGRYQESDATAQLVQPKTVVAEIMDLVFKAQRVFNYSVVAISCAVALFLILIVSLSLRLRSAELQTLHKLGCRRSAIFNLVAAELTLIAGTSAILSLVALGVVLHWAPSLMRLLLA